MAEPMHERNAAAGAALARASAIDLMGRALCILDRVGPHHAAATLALAIEHAGGVAAAPPG